MCISNFPKYFISTSSFFPVLLFLLNWVDLFPYFELNWQLDIRCRVGLPLTVTGRDLSSQDLVTSWGQGDILLNPIKKQKPFLLLIHHCLSISHIFWISSSKENRNFHLKILHPQFYFTLRNVFYSRGFCAVGNFLDRRVFCPLLHVSCHTVKSLLGLKHTSYAFKVRWPLLAYMFSWVNEGNGYH